MSLETESKDSVKSVTNDNRDNSFIFHVGTDLNKSECTVDNANLLLVDCGATAHISTDKSKFVDLDPKFNPEKYYIELANGFRSNTFAQGRGTAKVNLDSNGEIHEATLQNALYVPSFKQDIFSAKSATTEGVSVEFKPPSAEMKIPDGTTFTISKCGKLYYLNSVVTSASKNVSRSLRDWHNVMGHCNVADVLKIKNVGGMEITDKSNFECDVCVKGKMTQVRSRIADELTTMPLHLVHCDLAGPVDPSAKNQFRYALVFVDDYFGLVMIYLLKHKGDTVKATEKFLADVAPYGTVKRI